MAHKETIHIYTGTPHDDVSILPMLAGHFGRSNEQGNQLFKDFFDQLDFSFLQVVGEPKNADVLLIPHDYFVLQRNNNTGQYIDEFQALAQEHNKPVVLIAHGDSDEHIPLKNGYVFRTSQYGYKEKETEIIMPPYVEDMLGGAVRLRGKQTKPTVSFCGWAEFDSPVRYGKYIIKLLIQYVKYILGNVHALVHRQGIYVRRTAILILRRSEKVHTSFIIRRSYSGHAETISVPPERAREEYVRNIIDSDFVLAPKGDGNYSMRFYEALAMGRFPVLIDTDAVLPLSDEIHYHDIAVLVGHTEMEETPRKIVDFYDTLSESELEERQREARRVFEDYLRIDSFLWVQFNKLLGRR